MAAQSFPYNNKESHICCGSLSLLYPRLRLAVRLVVLRFTLVPQVLVQGFVARVLLGIECCGIRRYGAQVLPAHIHSPTDSPEALTRQGLVGADGCGTFDLLAQKQAVAVAARGCCYAVCAQQHLAARVLTALARF